MEDRTSEAIQLTFHSTFLSRGHTLQSVKHPPGRRELTRLVEEGAIARYNFPTEHPADAEKHPLSSTSYQDDD
jgi:hypothetical protein